MAVRSEAERAPLIHCMDDRSRAKISEHLSQAMVELYVSSLFWASIELRTAPMPQSGIAPRV